MTHAEGTLLQHLFGRTSLRLATLMNSELLREMTTFAALTFLVLKTANGVR